MADDAERERDDLNKMKVKDLQDILRTFAGAKVTGNKLSLIDRVIHCRAGANQVLAAAGTSGDTAPSPTPSKASSVASKAKPAASVKNAPAPLKKGEALAFVLLSTSTTLHAITNRCLMKLKAYDGTSDTESPHPELEIQLRPLLMLCESLVKQSESLPLYPSSATNMRDLVVSMELDLRGVAESTKGIRLHTSVLEIFAYFGGLPRRSAEDDDPNYMTRQFDGSDDDPIVERRRAEGTVMNEEQAAMQVFYKYQYRAATGHDPPELQAETQAEILVEDQPAEPAVAAEKDVDPSQTAQPVPTRPGNIGEGLPTIVEVREEFERNGWNAVPFNDLVKIGDVRGKGEEIANLWVEDLVVRSVLLETEPGSGRYELNAMPPPPPPALRAGGSTDKNIPGLQKEVFRICDGILTFLLNWSETFPEPDVGDWPRDFKENERKKIRNYIATALKTDGLLTAPDKDGQKEKQFIKNCLEDDNFPVVKGRNEPVIRAVFKEKRSHGDYKKRKSEDGTKAGEGDVEMIEAPGEAATAGAQSRRAGEKRGRNEDDDEDEEDGAVEGGRKRSKGDDGGPTGGAANRGDAGYGEAGSECLMCFVDGHDCSIKNGGLGECDYCEGADLNCRVLCSSCQDIIDTAGRGCMSMEMLAPDCGACERRS